MSAIAQQRPDFPRAQSYGRNDYRISSPPCSVSIPARKEKQLQKFENVKFCPANFKSDTANFQDDEIIELENFVAREALVDDEYWAAAWLRAESHWEDREYYRYAENCKRKFAEQEFNEMRKRYNSQLEEKCKCIVMARKEVINVKRTTLKSVVGTLDLSVRFLSHGQTFPGEQIKPPLFCLVDGKLPSRYGYISNLCVDKSARRKGIASRMLHFAVVSAKAQGAEKVFVHVYKNKISAQGLYQKLGFEVVDATDSQLSDDQTYLLCLEASDYLQANI